MDKVLDPKVLESAHNEYKLLEAELASMINARQAFLSQLNEHVHWRSQRLSQPCCYLPLRFVPSISAPGERLLSAETPRKRPFPT